MKETTQVLEGLQILLGTARINIAAFLTMLITIRKPPTFTEGDLERSADDLNTNAKITYWGLLITHFISAVFILSQSQNLKADDRRNLTSTRSFVVFLFVFMTNLSMWAWSKNYRRFFLDLYKQGYDLKQGLNSDTWAFESWVTIESSFIELYLFMFTLALIFIKLSLMRLRNVTETNDFLRVYRDTIQAGVNIILKVNVQFYLVFEPFLLPKCHSQFSPA